MDLPYDPEIPHLGIYPRGMKADFHTDTCIQMFIAANPWLNKLWLIYTREYQSAIKIKRKNYTLDNLDELQELY